MDVRHVRELPAFETIEGVRVLAPAELVAMKVISVTVRHGRAKGDTDAADLKRLLLAFPALKVEEGAVAKDLRSTGASDAVLERWRQIVGEPIEPDIDDY